jgi:hypothetical protein
MNGTIGPCGLDATVYLREMHQIAIERGRATEHSSKAFLRCEQALTAADSMESLEDPALFILILKPLQATPNDGQSR